MLNITRSNALERLLDPLAQQLSANPLASPLRAEIVVVPSPAMARWINLGLARRHGIAANIDYPLPASFVWRLGSRLLEDVPEQDPMAREAMALKIFAALPAMLAQPVFITLKRYLALDEDGVKRWQLSERIADVLDRYQYYRPALIRDWSQGAGSDWQAALWRQLATGLADQHRVAVIERLVRRLAAQHVELPARVSVFGVSSLPPLLLEVIHALAQETQVDLYLHTPTDGYWSDLVSARELARKRLADPENDNLWEVGNPLLSSWGRQGQALGDLLLDRDIPSHDTDVFAPVSQACLLTRVQADIFALRPTPADTDRCLLPLDDSIQVHICHSALRECQVLHDQLLGMFDADAQLQPEEVLVMVPEISLYAPCIEAVFGRDSSAGRPWIPWNISDISLQDQHPLIRVFLQLLELPGSRFSRSEVLSFLDVPELARHFGLEGDAGVQLRAWLRQAQIRWGLDGAHKQRLGLPAVEENTWRQAEQRLFGGYALAGPDLFQGIAPIDGVAGADAQVLGRFWRLLSLLADTAQRLAKPRSAAEWQGLLGRLLMDFFGEWDDEDDKIQKIRDAAAQMGTQAAGMEEPLSLHLVRHWLAESLGTQARRGRYFSGGVTFCGMRPMRSLPFAVICVLGLHDQAFPRRARPIEFDRMRREWRPGDPRIADEDRYLFLETLLCARKRLYLSYVGRDIRDNTPRQPSVLVQELLDYIDQNYRLADQGPQQRLSEHLTRVHPLQAFSRRNFQHESGSYDPYWRDVAKLTQRAAAPEGGSTLNWPESRLSPPPEEMRSVTLDQLQRFLRHPIRYFVDARLQVRLGEDPPEDDDECFAPDGLQRFQLQQRLVQQYLRGQDLSGQAFSAEGLLPHGAVAQSVLSELREQVAPLMEQLQPCPRWRPPIPIDLEFPDRGGGLRLSGTLSEIDSEHGLMRWKPTAAKGKDILALWLEHLAWCASGVAGEKCSRLYTSGSCFALEQSLDARAARKHLAALLRLYWRGLQQPLLLLPGASYAYAVKHHEQGKADPYVAARKAWAGTPINGFPGDRDEPYVQLVMRGVEGNPLQHADFAALAEQFFGPALAAGQWQ